MKRLAYPFLRLAYGAYVGWLMIKGRPWRSASVAVWHDGKLLKVRHSYRRGWSIPGGAVRRGEDPRSAACREVREEVGIHLEPDNLILVRDKWFGSRHYHLYECRLAERPAIEVDRWEVVEAKFFDPR